MSAVCESFGCLPSEAKGEDLTEIVAVIEYRMAKQAEAMSNKDVTEMAKYPGMVRLWKELADARDRLMEADGGK